MRSVYLWSDVIPQFRPYSTCFGKANVNQNQALYPSPNSGAVPLAYPKTVCQIGLCLRLHTKLATRNIFKSILKKLSQDEILNTETHDSRSKIGDDVFKLPIFGRFHVVDVSVVRRSAGHTLRVGVDFDGGVPTVGTQQPGHIELLLEEEWRGKWQDMTRNSAEKQQGGARWAWKEHRAPPWERIPLLGLDRNSETLNGYGSSISVQRHEANRRQTHK